MKSKTWTQWKSHFTCHFKIDHKNNQGSFMCRVKYTILMWEFN